ncbi:MAG: hypothetical protein KDI51_00850 [Xanthomonadales bacterium]|nr:hypothetical protein [Xanthomonadales bacterium]
MIVILHGWSDRSASFKRLAALISTLGLPGPVAPIMLGDYVSMDDDVHFDDIADAMQRAWLDGGLPTAPRSVDLVVHSTGALVARYWMTRHFTPDTNPIRRLLMLAPANFGSHLAHKGTSFLGRVVKGFKSKRLFHTGANILAGLELASPFSWELAMLDRFDAQRRWYGPGRVLATVLVGTAGYSGISAAANADGSDGTVLVSTAQLNPAMLELDFVTDPQKPRPLLSTSNGETAFCRLPKDNHSTAAAKDGGPRNPLARELIKAALSVTDAGFTDHCTNLALQNAQFRRDEVGKESTQGYQNTVVWVSDQYEADVRDYFLEAFAKLPNANREDRRLTGLIQTDVLTSVHTNHDNPAVRSLKFNCDRLQDLLVLANRSLYIAITASPEIADTRTAGYSTVSYNDIGSIQITPSELGRIFEPDRTLLVRLKLRREQTKGLVQFNKPT